MLCFYVDDWLNSLLTDRVTIPGKPGVLRDFYKRGKLREFCATSAKIFNKQNSFSSIKYLHNTTRSWASSERSIVDFGDGCSVLVTCYIAGVDVD